MAVLIYRDNPDCRASWDATSSSTPGARLQKKCWQINKIKPGKSFSSAGRAGSQTELCLLWILSAHSTNHLSKLLFLTKLQMETSSNFSLSRRRGSRSRVWQQGEGKRESFPEDVKFELHPEGVKSRVLQEEAGGTSFRAYVHVDGRAWSKTFPSTFFLKWRIILTGNAPSIIRRKS